ncbi:Ras-GAP domain-containing protein [Entamoeba marina]
MSVTFPTVQSTPVTESLSFDPLQTLLLPLNNDIPAGVLKHFCSTLNTPEQLFKNTEMVFAYYISEGKISQLIDYLIDREIEECFRTPSSIFRRNSIFTREIVSIVTKHLKQTKFKLVIGNTINADVEKSVVKIAEIINSVLENIVNCQKFPIGFRYFMHKVSVELHKRTPSVETSALKNLIFLRTINSALVHSQSKNQQELDSMKTLSVAFQWFVGDSTEQNIPPAQNWKIQLSEKLGSMRQKVDTWVTTLRDLELDDFFTLSWIKKEWKDVLEYLSTESQGLLSLHFSNEQETMRMYIRLTNELDAFSNGTVKEHSDLLMKMTAMTMQIKDLKAEIKYLKKVLVEKDPTLSYLLDHDH